MIGRVIATIVIIQTILIGSLVVIVLDRPDWSDVIVISLVMVIVISQVIVWRRGRS